MNNFSFYLGSKIEFGSNSIEVLPKYLEEYKSKKILVITDAVLIELKVIDPLLNILNREELDYLIYDKIKPNPNLDSIEEGYDFVKDLDIGLIIAIGGGSTLDTSKAIAMLLKNDDKCYNYLDGRGLDKKEITGAVDIIAIPTTAGTGSEVSVYSVITDYNHIKDSLTSNYLLPKVAIIDPVLTLKLPKKFSVYTGLDVFGHALEAYTSKISNELSDLMALEAIKIVFEYLPIVISENSQESREKLAYASMIAGSAMSNCGATLPHALGCALGGNLNLAHGLTVGVLQIPTIRYNKQSNSKEYKKILDHLKPGNDIKENDAAEKFIEMIEDLFVQLDFSSTLDMAVENQILDKMVEDASIHGCLNLNSRTMCKEDIRSMFKSII
jgi:alcohol dehydrogenase class IV